MQRTDLAQEAHKMCCDAGNLTRIDGVEAREENDGDIEITTVKVLDENGSRAISKPIGTYVTISIRDLKYDLEQGAKAAELLAKAIKDTGKIKKNGITMVVGLGNRDVTPDTVGTETAERILATRHMKQAMPDVFKEAMSSVCVITPGVLGVTGIESAGIIKGVAESIKPDCIIAVDALAAAEFSRVGTTVQVGDSGINPGSGVGNNREAVDEKSMGVPVIAVGMPTVTDTQTETGTAMVTPRDIDLIVRRGAKVISDAINMALQPGLSIEEIEEFIS